MSDLEEVFKDAIEKSDKCGQCGVITARIGGDSQAHWCCNCGAKLRGNHPYSAIANIQPRIWDEEKRQYEYLKMPLPAEVPMPEPVAYGIGNTAITGHTNRLMMVRIDIPGGDQYAGAFWLPLVLADEAHTYGNAREAAGYARVLEWAVSGWKAEVENRPLENKNRRSLDDVWRQVVRFAGGDPDALLGPSHDAAMRMEVKS